MTTKEVMDGLVQVLVGKFCNGVTQDEMHDVVEELGKRDDLTTREAVNAAVDARMRKETTERAAREARTVYDYLQAFEHEGKIRSVEQFGSSAKEIRIAIGHAAENRDWKVVAGLYNSFGQALTKAPTASIIAWGLRFHAHAANMQAGATNDEHVKTAEKLFEGVEKAIDREHERLVALAVGRA